MLYAAALVPRHGRAAGACTHSLLCTHAPSCAHSRARAPTHAHAYAGQGKAQHSLFLHLESTSSVFRCREPRLHHRGGLSIRWCECRDGLDLTRSFSYTRVHPLASTGHPNRATETPLCRARARQVATTHLLPELGDINLARDTYSSFFLCMYSPLCWCTHLDAAGNPSLTVIDFASTTAPAMASTLLCRFSSSRLHLSCPSEPNGPREPHRGTCCSAAVRPRHRRALVRPPLLESNASNTWQPHPKPSVVPLYTRRPTRISSHRRSTRSVAVGQSQPSAHVCSHQNRTAEDPGRIPCALPCGRPCGLPLGL
jgi:hypothetical protein